MCGDRRKDMTMRGIIYGLLVCDIFVAATQQVAYHMNVLQDKYKKLAADYTKKKAAIGINNIAVWLEKRSYIDTNGYFVKKRSGSLGAPKLFPVGSVTSTNPVPSPRVENSAYSRGVEVDVNNINIGD